MGYLVKKGRLALPAGPGESNPGSGCRSRNCQVWGNLTSDDNILTSLSKVDQSYDYPSRWRHLVAPDPDPDGRLAW